MSDGMMVAGKTALRVTLVAAVTPFKVYDKVPARAARPYVAIVSQVRQRQSRPFNKKRHNLIFQLEIPAADGGSDKVSDLIDKIVDAVDEKRDLPMSIGRWVMSFAESEAVSLDIDGETSVGRCVIRVIVDD